MNSHLKSYINSFIAFCVIIMLVWSCAKPLSPSGGPKDETPPKITKSLPANGSTNFHGDEIIISFNEYVHLKDINSQLIISPPVREVPDFRLKGKSLLLKFKESRREETTYNIFLGNAIQDITENNAIEGYKFTFSTGNILDSMMIEGKLINSFTLTPVKSAYVMLYDSVYDSVPYKQLPYYIARTNDNGEFQLTNLRNIPYKIFALTDINANYLFDQPNEEIAFLDTLITPWYVEKPAALQVGLDSINSLKTAVNDSLKTAVNDSLKTAVNDSLKPLVRDSLKPADSVVLTIVTNDSIAITDTVRPAPVQDSMAMKTDSLMVVNMGKKYLQMFHFREIDTVQSLLKASLIRQNVFSLSYKRPVRNPRINVLSEGYTGKTVVGQNRINDTLTVWFPGFVSDSIMFEVSDNNVLLDTIEMSVKPKEKPGKKADNQKGPVLHFTNNLLQGKIKPGSTLRLNFQDPVETYKFEDIILLEDTLPASGVKIAFADSIHSKLTVKYPWKEGIAYTLLLNDSIMSSIMGTYNDSTAIKFTGLKEEETASIALNLDLPEDTPYIIQLLDPKEKLIEQYQISQDLTIDFRYLMPGKYKLKAIDDRNGNGIWDTGKYLTKRYPERVLYFSKELDLRANWTVEEQWQIPQPGK